MKLYTAKGTPNGRRVEIFLAEKHVEIPSVQVDLRGGENITPEFRDMNPMGRIPVLEMEDGTFISESVAICRYFEETQPEPPLLGVDAVDRALVEMWQRRMELEVFFNTAGSFRHTHEFFKGRIPQVPEYGEVCKKGALKRLAWLDEELADREFIAGDRFSIADITALCGIDFGRVTGIAIAPEQGNLARWHQAVSNRPSAKA